MVLRGVGIEIAYGATRLSSPRVASSLLLGALAAYAPAMKCPVLTERMVLRPCYEISGTNRAYGATPLL
eukprot:352096-Rhodomonas_salina.1